MEERRSPARDTKQVGNEIAFFDESGIALVIKHIPNWTDFPDLRLTHSREDPA